MRALAALLLALSAAAAAAQEGCPTAETARSKGFTVRLDNGTVLTVAPGSATAVVAYEERLLVAGGRTFVSQYVIHAGIVSLSVDNDELNMVFTFDKPVEDLVPKAVGQSVEFNFKANMAFKSGEKRTREGIQRHSVVGSEQIIVGRCSYTAQVFLKSGRYPSEDESYEQRILYVPDLRLPLMWRIESRRKGENNTIVMRAAGIEEGN